MKIAIVGSRHNTKEFIEFSLNFFRKLFLRGNIDLVITGGAMGIDTLAETTANEFNIPVKIIRPKNPKIKQDYILRNFKIVDFADKIYAFWDGKSPGTRSVIKYCKSVGKYLVVVQIK